MRRNPCPHPVSHGLETGRTRGQRQPCREKGKRARLIYADRMAGESVAEVSPYSPALRRTGKAACLILFALIIISAVHDIPSQSPPVMAVTAAALLVGLGGMSWYIAVGGHRGPPPLVTLTATGLAGAVLVATLP